MTATATLTSAAKPLQLTLALLKPDLVAHPTAHRHVRAAILENGFRICAGKPLLWRQVDAETFYAEHRGRFFFERLTGYMTSGPFAALVLAKPNAISDWRKLIGPTRPVRARLEDPATTLRARFGLTDTRNSFHGSDSHETSMREISIFFPELDIEKLVSQLPTSRTLRGDEWKGQGEDFDWAELGFDDDRTHRREVGVKQ